MSDLAGVLDAFHAATGCEAGVWTQAESNGDPRAEAATPRAPSPAILPAVADGVRSARAPDGDVLVAAIPGPRRAWLALGPCSTPGMQLDAFMGFLLPVVTQYLQSALEVEHAANELAERYEEINLLYTISEILGRTVALEEAASVILAEVSETVGARRATVLVHDRATNTLRAVAARGVDVAAVPPIDVNDDCSVSARVFREQHLMLVEDDEAPCPAEVATRRGALLSVPIMWTAPARGAEPLGVVNLSDRRSGQPFTAGDQKLIAAIATQIGTAIQNARLVRASVDQQRLAHEMQLAHDLQMKLLPSNTVVAPGATVAARVVPAESVGGDFYNLFRLSRTKTGVMIGDVSGHGYQAALIMALAMSAAAIHSQTTTDPGEVLDSLGSSLEDELAVTEMFISSFYAVIDPAAGELRYSNSGHPHAFVLRGGAPDFERLAASDPPIGMSEEPPHTERRAWEAKRDLLVLFTDGVVDARNRRGERLGEERVLRAVLAGRDEEPAAILARVMALVDAHIQGEPRRDDLTVVLLRS